MKKKVKKLWLNSETILRLEPHGLHGVGGAAATDLCTMGPTRCNPDSCPCGFSEYQSCLTYWCGGN